MAKECVLYDRICNDCGECFIRQFNPLKMCDNCGKCLETGKDYREIKIDRRYHLGEVRVSPSSP